MDTYCQNCGEESHCDTNITMKINGREVGVHEIVICKNCKCVNCKKEKDPKNEF